MYRVPQTVDVIYCTFTLPSMPLLHVWGHKHGYTISSTWRAFVSIFHLKLCDDFNKCLDIGEFTYKVLHVFPRY